jgi:hypothetical protein
MKYFFLLLLGACLNPVRESNDSNVDAGALPVWKTFGEPNQFSQSGVVFQGLFKVPGGMWIQDGPTLFLEDGGFPLPAPFNNPFDHAANTIIDNRFLILGARLGTNPTPFACEGYVGPEAALAKNNDPIRYEFEARGNQVVFGQPIWNEQLPSAPGIPGSADYETGTLAPTERGC